MKITDDIRNAKSPELDKLVEVLNEYDWLLQEGVILPKAEKDRALFLLEQFSNIVNEIRSR